MKKLLGSTVAAACIAVLASSAAIAQTAPNADARPASSHRAKFEDRAFARPTERIEARLAYVRTALKITGAQQPQWDAYADLARKNAKDMEQRFESRKGGAAGRPERQRLNSIERLERQQAFHAEAITRLNDLLAVEKPLYAALSPEQRKVADVVLNARPHSGNGERMHGRGGFGRG